MSAESCNLKFYFDRVNVTSLWKTHREHTNTKSSSRCARTENWTPKSTRKSRPTRPLLRDKMSNQDSSHQKLRRWKTQRTQWRSEMNSTKHRAWTTEDRCPSLKINQPSTTQDQRLSPQPSSVASSPTPDWTPRRRQAECMVPTTAEYICQCSFSDLNWM